MKRILFLLLVVSRVVVAQDFSGEVTYQRKIIAKTPSFNADSMLNDKNGDSFIYTLSGPFYKCVMLRNGKQVSQYSYHHSDFRFYQQRHAGYIAYSDSRDTSTTVTFTVHPDSLRTVAGYTCFLVEKKYPDHTTKSYYSRDIRINPETFKGHTAARWYEELKATNGSFHLLSIEEHAEYIEIYEAVKVEQKAIDPSVFAPPKDLPLFPSWNVLDQQPALQPATRAAYKCYKEKLSSLPQLYGGQRSVRCFMMMVVDTTGKVSYVHPMEEDEYGAHRIAKDILLTCGLTFQPATLNGKAVSAEMFFPIEFTH